jgi:hypothetical protein
MNESALPLSTFKIEKALKEVIADMMDFNIFNELSIERCGFNEQGEFRVYVPPINVLNERKLTSSEKLKMNVSINNIIRFWQTDPAVLADNNVSGYSTSRHSYRFNSPQIRKENHNDISKMHRLSEENTDIKKTIKLSKNYRR